MNPFDDPDPVLYKSLIKQGFRRSGNTIYRAYCTSCHRCIPVRLSVKDFLIKRRFRRTLIKNAGITLKVTQACLTDEYFSLYKRYVNTQHADGSMANPSKHDFINFLSTKSWPSAVFIEFRLDDRLVAVAVTDVIDDGFSCVYTFYDPNEKKRSLGQFDLLKQIQMTLDYQLSFLYLGYWIKESVKMVYKTDYQPLQYFFNGQWISKSELKEAVLCAGLSGVV